VSTSFVANLPGHDRASTFPSLATLLGECRDLLVLYPSTPKEIVVTATTAPVDVGELSNDQLATAAAATGVLFFLKFKTP
jgi:hypothetical protein